MQKEPHAIAKLKVGYFPITYGSIQKENFYFWL